MGTENISLPYDAEVRAIAGFNEFAVSCRNAAAQVLSKYLGQQYSPEDLPLVFIVRFMETEPGEPQEHIGLILTKDTPFGAVPVRTAIGFNAIKQKALNLRASPEGHEDEAKLVKERKNKEMRDMYFLIWAARSMITQLTCADAIEGREDKDQIVDEIRNLAISK